MPASDYEKDAFESGNEAHADGLTIESNPYQLSFQKAESAAWKKGWKKAERKSQR